MHLGAQLFIEPDDSADDVRRRVAVAAEHGLTTLRTFLLWPWLEAERGRLGLELHDVAFDAAAEHGIGIRATLSPESRPWHLGVTGLVQSTPPIFPAAVGVRDAVDEFVGRCVDHFADHPALAQWVLWNEPQRPFPGRDPRDWSPGEARIQRELLEDRYGSIEALNRAWLTGFASFAEVPHPSRVAAGGDGSSPFWPYDAWRTEADVRAAALAEEVRHIAAIVREHDPRTPISLNPPGPLDNQAGCGFDLDELAGVPDVMGGSIHAPWHLTFAPATDHLGLIGVGVSLLRSLHSQGRAELTEMQGGQVTQGAPGSQGIAAQDVASAYAVAAFAGAEATITWSLDPRTRGFEAGDWAMVGEDGVTPGPALPLARRTADALRRLDEALPGWRPVEPEIVAVVDRAAQTQDWVAAMTSSDAWGADAYRGPRGAARVALAAQRMGRPAAVVTAAALARRKSLAGLTIVVPQVAAPSDVLVAQLGRALDHGARVVIDARSLRFGDDWRLARGAGPALVAELGVTALWLRSPSLGAAAWAVSVGGGEVGRVPGPFATVETDEGWTVDAGCAVAGSPLLLSDPDRHVSLVTTALGWDTPEALVRRIVGDPGEVAPLDPSAHVQVVEADEGRAYLVVRPEATAGTPLAVRAPRGTYLDLWSDTRLATDGAGTLTLPAGQALALLLPSRAPDETDEESAAR
ncbi:hypothetical protein GCM10028815_08340 [Mariniluteicoccus flavus]